MAFNKDKFFEVIKRIDYILILIGCCLAIFFISLFILEQFVYRLQRRPASQIAVVEKEDVEIKEYIDFNNKIRDVFVFDVRSTGIKAEDLYTADAKLMPSYSNISGKGKSYDGITNFIFVNENTGEEYKLFKNNAFIYKYSFMTESTDPYIRNHQCNIYAVIRSDTNGDKILSSNDNISLYISDYDGKNVRELSSSIMGFYFTDDQQFIFTEYDGSQMSYFVCDCRTGSKTLLKTVKQDVTVKRINM